MEYDEIDIEPVYAGYDPEDGWNERVKKYYYAFHDGVDPFFDWEQLTPAQRDHVEFTFKLHLQDSEEAY